MKIIIFSILLTVQAQNIDDGLISNEASSIMNDLSLVTQNRFLETSNEMNFSTERISSDVTYENQTWPSLSARDYWSLSPTTDLDFTTDTTVITEEQWFNVNQSNARDPYRSMLFWKRTSDPSWYGATYILTSEPRCVRQMCSVKLMYNGSLSTRVSGCLSFSLRTRGQPIGQLWIVEDQQQENISQTIQLTNKTLRIEHSLKSKIKNLSIDTRILFRNPQIDTLTLSNLYVDWKGPCPKTRRIPTPSPDILARRSTFGDDFMTLTSDVSGSMATNEGFESSQQYLIDDFSTISPKKETDTKRPFSFLNQKNFGWFLSLITIFCFAIVLSAVGHGLWFIRRHQHFSWHVTFDTQIQFLARRSLRSSTRSENKIATISQIASDILKTDSQKENADTSTTTSSSRSTPLSYYTYL